MKYFLMTDYELGQIFVLHHLAKQEGAQNLGILERLFLRGEKLSHDVENCSCRDTFDILCNKQILKMGHRNEFFPCAVLIA